MNFLLCWSHALVSKHSQNKTKKQWDPSSWILGVKTVEVPQTQFLTVVEWLKLDKIGGEGEEGARSDYCRLWP